MNMYIVHMAAAVPQFKPPGTATIYITATSHESTDITVKVSTH